MSRRKWRAAIALPFVAAAVAVPLTVSSLASADDQHSLAAVAKSATAKFHDVGDAEQAGYGLFKDMNGIACIDNQPVGGMGVHYVNGSYVGDAVLDPTKPEALVYAPNGSGQLKLAALEYIVFADAWAAAGHSASDPPSLFGQTFALTPAGNRFGIPAFWSLHAWIWQPNPSGLLQPWNPRVQC
jgi:hypothetical protein